MSEHGSGAYGAGGEGEKPRGLPDHWARQPPRKVV